MENINQVKEMNELISLSHNQTLNSPKFTLLYKIFKIAKFTIADYIVLNYTNTKLIITNT